MGNKLPITLHSVKVFVGNHDASGIDGRFIPERRTEVVKRHLRGVDVGDTLGVDGVVAVDDFDDGVCHGCSSFANYD